ncbi:lipopolysaccharide biosynthesis protein [Priestia megaterium]|uniref:lipopolysaccharide biosynthesis protein n=1 Tax=Priestia megaterium TaxID=1404 RepID=UPI002FFE62F8
MQGKSLIQKTGLYFIGNLSSKIMSTLIIPIYAFYVKANDLGYYDYTQTIMSILIPVVFVAIWEAILRHLLYETDEIQKRKVISTSTGFTILMSFIVIILMGIYREFIDSETKFVFFITIMFIVYALTQIWQYYARALSKNKLYILSGIIGTFVNFISVLVFICILKLGLKGLFISYILGQVSIFLLIESRLHILREFKIKYFDVNTLNEMIKFSIPLVLNLTSAWVLSGFGKTLIADKLGTDMNGLFSFASKFSILVTMIGSVVTMAVIEEAIITVKTKGFNSEFTRIIENVFKIFITLALLSIPIIKVFYFFIKDTEYYSSFSYAPWLIISAVLITMASNVGAIFQAINKTKYQFTTTLFGAVITIIISLTLISIMGVYSVILGQILGGLAMLFARYLLVNRYVDFEINWKPIVIAFCFLLLIILISTNTSILVNVIILILTAIIVSYLNKNYLLIGCKILRNRFNR